MFKALTSVVDGNLNPNLSSEILAHLTDLKKEFLRYFPEISNANLELVRKPFSIPVEKFREDLQGELIDLRNDSACKNMFDNLSICKFWVLLSFSITYLCESRFLLCCTLRQKFVTVSMLKTICDVLSLRRLQELKHWWTNFSSKFRIDAYFE